MNEAHAALLNHPRLAAGRRQVQELDAAARQAVTEDAACRVVWRCWGQGPGLVLLHGAYGSWLHFAANIEALSSNYTVWAPDIPGFGDSVLFDEHNVSFEGIGGALAHGFRALHAGGGPVTLAAFSFGTRLAADMAQHATFERILLAGPIGFAERVPLRTEPRRWRDIQDIKAMMAAQRHNLLALMLHDPASADDLAVYIQMRNAFQAKVTPKAPPTGSVWAKLKATGLPVDVLWGQHDAYHGPLLAQRRERVQQWLTDVRIETLPQAGHWVMYEDPDNFNSFVRATRGRESAA
jgi:pimeloyl-ACP methyl ester carboxylesterase